MTPDTNTAARVAEQAGGLAERDRRVLDTLARLRLATSRQIERIHFTGASPLSNARSSRRVLARLEGLSLAARLNRRVGGIKAGSAGVIWSLGVSGQRLVTGAGPAGGSQRRRPWTPSPAFTDHRLAITELYVELVEATRQGRGVLERFAAEPDSWRRYSAPFGGTATLKPDAYVVTSQEVYEHVWMVEVDRATESPTVIRRKAAAYVEYFRTGNEQATTGIFPLVVFSVPSAARVRSLTQVISRLDASEQPLFRVITATQTCELLLRGES